MSRLTERFGQNATTKEPCYIPAGIGAKDQVLLHKIVEKLGRLEDLEEACRLIELPCKVGDTVYVIDYDYYEEIYESSSKYYYVEERYFDYEMLHWMGKWCFLTKAEAEVKLAELKEGE